MNNCFKAILFVLFIISNSAVAQNSIKNEGNRFFEAKKYEQALWSYNNYDNISSNAEALVKRGISNYYLNKPKECIKDMIQADMLKSDDNCRIKYTAMSYLALQDYKEAAVNFKLFLKYLKPNDTEFTKTVQQIKRCGHALNLKYINQAAYVENLGPNVNTKFNEVTPILSPTKPGRFYFSSARETSIGGLRNDQGITDILYGHYSADMFLVDLENGNWSNVLTIEPLLNSPKHDILQDFSPDGSIIYFLKSNDLRYGVLYSDTFSLERDPIKLPVKAELPFNAEDGDKDLFVFSDSLIIFSSNRKGGYGGYDLYYSIKSEKSWSKPLNFGDKINTSFSESSPFLTRGGIKLYFSSDRIEGFGGFDLFSADFEEFIGWTSVTNLGLGMNSAGDDIHIELSADGLSALFASNRIESIGGYDLYLGYFKDQVLDQLGYTEAPLFTIKNIEGSTSGDNSIANQKTMETYPYRDFLNQALYFKDNDDVLNSSNLSTLKKLADLLIIYPETNVLLTSHYLSEGRTDLDLYFSIKRAEKAADKLISYGISPQRIILQGCGANYPIAMPLINGLTSSLAEKTNKRIDIKVLNIDGLNLHISTEYPIVADQYREAAWDEFMKKNEGITYRIKFAKVTQMLKSEIIDPTNNVIIEKKANESSYSYTIGNYGLFADALVLKQSLISQDAPMAIIRPYLNGVELEDSDVLKFLDTFPTLLEFISGNN